MADVRLLYPIEKMEAASRLAEAVAAAGYAVDRQALADPRAFPDLGAEAGGARVLLLVWSRALVAAAMAGGALAAGRRHPNLIEVSVDGIEPVCGAEGSPVVLLCGWRGQPYHPGWQRILAQIRRLCGSREASAKAPAERRAKGGATTAAGAPAGPKGAARKALRRRPILSGAMAAGAVLAVTLAAAATLDRDGPAPAPRTEAAPPEAPALPGGAAPAAVAAAAIPAGMAADPPPAAAPAAPVTVTERAADPVRTGPRRPPAAAIRPKRVAAAADREVKRYSRKYSRTMRLFCQRSGRSTPQCRTFARSTRPLRG
jgi:hypothetical protein